MTLERRTFLVLLGGGVLTATGGATALVVAVRSRNRGDGGSPADRGERTPAVEAARAVVGGGDGARRVGALYLAAHPDHPATADPNWFPAGVVPADAGDARRWLRATPSARIADAVRDAVRAEFAAGAAQRIGGWWFTPTTGGLCALIARHG